jgi:hypothetical protein
VFPTGFATASWTCIDRLHFQLLPSKRDVTGYRARPSASSEVDEMNGIDRKAPAARRSFGLRFTRRHVDLVRVSSALCSL